MGSVEGMVTLEPIDLADEHERERLARLLTTIDVPFHVAGTPDLDSARARVASGSWGGPADTDGDHRAFWIRSGSDVVGTLRLDDLTDDAPMFDLRLHRDARGRGLGTAALAALADEVFGSYGAVDRIEGQTREDNLPMRRAFGKSGWTKEAHYRRGWPIDGAEPVASVAYALLRSEWMTGERVPLVWDDEPA